MVLRRLVVVACGASLAVAGACSDPPPPPSRETRLHPEIVTSPIPPAEENRPPPPQPAANDRARRDAIAEAERVAEAVRAERNRPFYDRELPDDTTWELQSKGAADEAFEGIMRSAVEPFRAPDPSSDVENPSNQPGSRGAQGWADGQQRVLLTCEPKVALKKGKAPNAQAFARLPIGTTLTQVVEEEPEEGSAEADTPPAPTKPSKTPPKVMTHVETSDGKRGWVDEAQTREVSGKEPSEAYLTCCNIVRDAENANGAVRERFATRVDYIGCLNRGVTAAGAANPPALALARTMAVARAAELVDRAAVTAEPFKGFVSRYGGQLAWTTDGYVLKASELWTLEEKYHGTEAGESFAWQAAHDGAMDRGCNREVACNVGQARARWGEYLARYPSGPHAREALDVIIAMRPRDENDATLPLDRNTQSVEQCLKTLGELAAIVDNTRAVGRVQASGALEALRRFVIARSGYIQGRR